MSDKKSLEHYHNKGQKDGSNNEYNPPRLSLFVNSQKHIDERKKYDAGYRQGKNQRDK